MYIPRFGFRILDFERETRKRARARPSWSCSSKLEGRPGQWRKSLGLSLVEQIVFIVVVGAAVAGVLAALDLTARGSADPMIQKQALAIAEAVLEEVQLQPFTYCDPDDANAATALSPAGCTMPEAIGREAGETRLGVPAFDNVNDYHDFVMSGITDISGSAIAGLEDYNVRVAVSAQGIPGPPAIPADEALLIAVTVTAPVANVSVTLHGYRVRYAPNALP